MVTKFLYLIRNSTPPAPRNPKIDPTHAEQLAVPKMEPIKPDKLPPPPWATRVALFLALNSLNIAKMFKEKESEVKNDKDTKRK